MQVTKIPKYITPYCVVEFYPVVLPDYTHRVYFGGLASDLWLSAKSKPSVETAKFFARVFRARQEKLSDQFYYADRKL